jgi:hypothetical protein
MTIRETAKHCLIVLCLVFASPALAGADEAVSGDPDLEPVESPTPTAAPTLVPAPPAGETATTPAPTPTVAPGNASGPIKAESLRPMFELQFAISPLYYNYSEIVPSPLKSSETGILPAFGVYGTFLPPDSIEMFRLGIDFAVGTTNYDGTTQTGTPATGTTSDTMIDVELNYGLTLWTISETSRLRFYTGISSRYWKRYGQYREDYSWYDLPLGVRYENDVSPDFCWDIDFSVKPTFGGRIKVFFSGYDPTLQDSTGILEDDIGAKLKVPITFWRRSFLPLVVTPWLEYITFSQGPQFPIESTGGTLQGTAFEPASRAFRLGVYLGTAFGF